MGIVRLVRALGIVALVLAVFFVASADKAAGQEGLGNIQGSLARSGFSLAQWSGGTAVMAQEAAATQGCGLKSLWTYQAGKPVGYILGAPAFVNSSFTKVFPSAFIPAGEILGFVCEPITPRPPTQGSGSDCEEWPQVLREGMLARVGVLSSLCYLSFDNLDRARQSSVELVGLEPGSQYDTLYKKQGHLAFSQAFPAFAVILNPGDFDATGPNSLIASLGHEICHANQYWYLVVKIGDRWTPPKESWPKTPAGKAFAAIPGWEEVDSTPFEAAAEVCMRYFDPADTFGPLPEAMISWVEEFVLLPGERGVAEGP